MIQGGKLSGQFFGVFTLEMTQISRIIKDVEFFREITGNIPANNQTSDLASAGYVDDINHVACNANKDDLEDS